MASPLLPYTNAYVKVTQKGAVAQINGRFVAAAGTTVAVRCFLKRAQNMGSTTGGTKQPYSGQQASNLLPGASGEQFLYRGYALQMATVAADWVPGDAATWSDVTAALPGLRPGTDVLLFQGVSDPMKARVERNDGVFGGVGIDEILYAEIGGTPLMLTGAEVQN